MEERDLKAAALTEINDGILLVAGESPMREESWEFFCECGQEDCHEHVVFTIAGYCALRERGESVLAPGHWVSRGEKARRKSRRLRDDAAALCAQARHQVRRAKKKRV